MKKHFRSLEWPLHNNSKFQTTIAYQILMKLTQCLQLNLFLMLNKSWGLDPMFDPDISIFNRYHLLKMRNAFNKILTKE